MSSFAAQFFASAASACCRLRRWRRVCSLGPRESRPHPFLGPGHTGHRGAFAR